MQSEEPDNKHFWVEDLQDSFLSSEPEGRAEGGISKRTTICIIRKLPSRGPYDKGSKEGFES